MAQRSITNKQIESSPTPVLSAASIRPLNEQDIQRLDERFPKRQREILLNARHIDVFETEDCPLEGWKLSPVKSGKFQGCGIVRRAKVSDREQIKELIDGVLFSIGSPLHSGAACFTPKHGIRAVHNGERLEMLICFECENFRGVSSLDTEIFAGVFSTVSMKLFERILSGKPAPVD